MLFFIKKRMEEKEKNIEKNILEENNISISNIKNEK